MKMKLLLIFLNKETCYYYFTFSGQSILERLMKLELYKKGRNNMYDPRYITKLRRNYRSHPAIIRVSNELYYDNDLIACSKQKCFSPKEFPKNFPIIFHSINGKEQKEKNSTR